VRYLEEQEINIQEVNSQIIHKKHIHKINSQEPKLKPLSSLVIK
jgi:hypothetical protein